ncbi:hypothetical protein TWF281_007317 [Arthrobotrys megalospora]
MQMHGGGVPKFHRRRLGTSILAYRLLIVFPQLLILIHLYLSCSFHVEKFCSSRHALSRQTMQGGPAVCSSVHAKSVSFSRYRYEFGPNTVTGLVYFCTDMDKPMRKAPPDAC